MKDTNRNQTAFVCSSCGFLHSKWQGRCQSCGSWNSLSEEFITKNNEKKAGAQAARAFSAFAITEIPSQTHERVFTGLSEFDRVLGGGLVPGELILLSGDPGIGKSTLILQTLFLLAVRGFQVLYVSGEESLSQIRLRAERLGMLHENILLSNELDAHSIIELTRQKKPKFLVVDSVQTIHREDLQSSAGSVTQVRECTSLLMEFAKSEKVTTIIIGHVTKEGHVAGPRVLEHLVDAVLTLEGDPQSGYRLLRSTKNRFGSTGELGVFMMAHQGLVEVQNPSMVFVEKRARDVEGSCIALCMEGSRPLLVEIQYLVTKSFIPSPRRVFTGLEYNRMNVLSAVIEKRLKFPMSSYDVFASVMGGIKVTEPSADLACVAALISSFKAFAWPRNFAFVGEVALSGELRYTTFMQQRISEAARMGFERVYMPSSNWERERKSFEEIIAKYPQLQIYPINHIYNLIED